MSKSIGVHALLDAYRIVSLSLIEKTVSEWFNVRFYSNVRFILCRPINLSKWQTTLQSHQPRATPDGTQ